MPRPNLSDNASERARQKAQMIVDATPKPSFGVEDGQRIRIQVKSAPYIDEHNALTVDDVSVDVDGEEVDVSASLPWRFVNPPLLIPDEQGDIERTNDNGEVRRYRNDPASVLQQMLLETARRVIG